MIYQELSLAPHLSVMENILLGAEPMRFGLVDWPAHARRWRATRWRSSGTTTSRPTRRSARCRSRRSSSSRSRARSPSAAACSCSTSRRAASGATTCERLFALLRRLKAQGHAIVYISHFIEEVKSDHRSLRRPARRPERGRRRHRRTPTHDAIVALMVGHRARTICFRARRGPRGEAILEVDALEPGSASFSLHRGEILGIAGLLGAGRTRLLRTLFGLEPVQARTGPRRRLQRRAARRTIRWARGHGPAERGPQERRARARRSSIADNLTMTRLEPFGPRALVLPARQRAGGGALDRAAGHQVRRARARPPASCRAATSRRSRSRGCSTTTWTS